jgi:hypothetical protein
MIGLKSERSAASVQSFTLLNVLGGVVHTADLRQRKDSNGMVENAAFHLQEAQKSGEDRRASDYALGCGVIVLIKAECRMDPNARPLASSTC